MESEVAPVIDEHEQRAPLPGRDRQAARRARLARHPDPRGRGRRRARHPGLRHRGRGDRPGLGLARAHRRGPHVASAAGRCIIAGTRRAEGALPRPDGHGRGHRRLWAHRAGRRLRRRRHADDGPPRGRPDGGTWVIDGGKRFITNAGQAGTYIVTARTGDEGRRRRRDQRVHRPGRHARLPRRPARGQAGPPRLGDRRADLRAAPASPPTNLLGEQGDGFRTFLKILDGGRISIGALALGLAQARATTRPSRTRRRASSSAGRSARSRASRS